MSGLHKLLFASALALCSAAGAEDAPAHAPPVILDLKATTLDLVGFPSDTGGAVLDLQSKAADLAKQSADITFRDDKDAVTLSIRSDVLFAFDSDAIAKKAEPTLKKVAQLIVDDPDGAVTIEGHTDSVGSDKYNLDLSQRRARSVAKWLTAHGVDSSRLSEKGKGESQPVASNDSDAGRAKNRRVDFVLPKKKA